MSIQCLFLAFFRYSSEKKKARPLYVYPHNWLIQRNVLESDFKNPNKFSYSHLASVERTSGSMASERAGGCALSILAYQTSCFCFRGDNSPTRYLGLARFKSLTWKVHQRNLCFLYSGRIFLNLNGYPQKRYRFSILIIHIINH